MQTIEETLKNKAKQLDVAEGEMLQRAAPQGKFSDASIKKVCDAINTVLALFEGAPPCEVGQYEPGSLPVSFIKNFEMINAAVKAAGLDEMVIDYMTAKDDKELILIVGKLASLAASPQFKSFLRSEKEDAKATVEEPAEPVEEAPSEELLLSRI